MNVLINWDKVFPILDKMSSLKVYIGIVAGIVEAQDGEYLWFSIEESRDRIAWRYQIAESTVKGAIKHLAVLKIIKVKSRGIYIINKEYLV